MHSVLLELNLFFLFEVFANFPSVRDYSCYFKGKVIYFLIIKHHILLKGLALLTRDWLVLQEPRWTWWITVHFQIS